MLNPASTARILRSPNSFVFRKQLEKEQISPLGQEGQTRAIVFDRERRGGRQVNARAALLVASVLDLPPRLRQQGRRPFLYGAATPPGPGGEICWPTHLLGITRTGSRAGGWQTVALRGSNAPSLAQSLQRGIMTSSSTAILGLNVHLEESR